MKSLFDLEKEIRSQNVVVVGCKNCQYTQQEQVLVRLRSDKIADLFLHALGI